MSSANGPGYPSEITAAWLGEQLGRRVDRIRMEIIGQDRGFVGTIARLTFEEDGAVASVVAKLASEAETRWYREAGSVLADVMPRYLGGSDTMLLLEDLSELEPGDFLTGTTALRVRAVLEAMDVVRSAWPTRPAWIHEWNGGNTTRKAARLTEALTKLDGFLEVPAESRLVLEMLSGLVPEVLSRLRQGPAGVIHTDLHLDNVFFDGDTAVLTDWHGVIWGPISLDVAHQLAQMPTEADRREMEDPFRAEFGDDLALGLLWYVMGAARWVTESARADLPPRQLAVMDHMLGSGRLFAALEDWDAVGVLSRLEGDRCHRADT